MTNHIHGNVPVFPVAKLKRETSESGSTYFTGRWGGARVFVVKSPEPDEDGSEVWGLLLTKVGPTEPKIR